MSDETPHEKMRRHDELDAKAHEYEKRKTAVHNEVKETLTDAIETATETTGVTVDLEEVNQTGETFTFRPKFDKGDLIAEIESQLPQAFNVDRIYNDGRIDVMWTEATDPEDDVNVSIVLEGIIRELTEESDVMTEESPTREEVVDYAVSLGFEQDEVEETLTRYKERNRLGVDENGHIWMQ